MRFSGKNEVFGTFLRAPLELRACVYTFYSYPGIAAEWPMPCVKVLGHVGGREDVAYYYIFCGNLSSKLPVIFDFCANLKHKISVCWLPK